MRGFDPNDIAGSLWVSTALQKYADTIGPWAEAAAKAFVSEVAAREKRQWESASGKIGRAVRSEFFSDPTGRVAREALAEQVALIKSIPLEAAERVHGLAQEALPKGERHTSLVQEIMRQGDVSRSKATLIARTETGRVSTEFTKARARSVGSEGYVWHSAGDADVRPSHRAMNGKFVRWDSPPTLDGMTGHAGTFPNCRCFCAPVLPDD